MSRACSVLALVAQLAIVAHGPGHGDGVSPASRSARRSRAPGASRRVVEPPRRIGIAAAAQSRQLARRARRRGAVQTHHRGLRPTSPSRRSGRVQLPPFVATVGGKRDRRPTPIDRRRARADLAAAGRARARAAGRRARRRVARLALRRPAGGLRRRRAAQRDGAHSGCAATRPSFRRRCRRCWRTTSTSRAACRTQGRRCFETLTLPARALPALPGRRRDPAGGAHLLAAALVVVLLARGELRAAHRQRALRRASSRRRAAGPPTTPAPWARSRVTRARRDGRGARRRSRRAHGARRRQPAT